MAAHSFHVSPPIRTEIEGRSYISWIVTETNALAASEWHIDEVPAFFTITLFETAVKQDSQPAPNSGHKVNPKIGTKAAWSEDSVDHVAANLKARKAVRNGCSLRVMAPLNVLYGCSVASLYAQGSGTDEPIVQEGYAIPVIVTRISIVEGH